MFKKQKNTEVLIELPLIIAQEELDNIAADFQYWFAEEGKMVYSCDDFSDMNVWYGAAIGTLAALISQSSKAGEAQAKG